MAKRGYVEIDGVQHPTGGPKAKVTAYVLVSDFNNVAKFNMFKAELMKVAQDVLRAPAAIFEAERNVRDKVVMGYCYTAVPDRIPNGRGGTMPMPPDHVVAVYVDKAFNVWEWRLEPCGRDSLTPTDPEARFGKQLF